MQYGTAMAKIAAEPKIEGRTAVLQNVLDCKGKTDAAERKNLATERPDKVKELLG